MRRFSLVPVAIALMLCGPARPQDDAADAEVRRILDRAAKALGGEKRAAYRGVTVKGKGKFRQADIALVFQGEFYTQGTDRFRQDLTLGDNQDTSLTLVLTPDKAWAKAVVTMDLPERLAPLRDDFYALALSQQPHLLRREPFKVSPLGEVQVQGQATLGLRISRKGWPAVNVFYDKETYLPRKAEVRIIDPSTAQEVSDEFHLSEYREFDGLPHYTKVVGTRDSREYGERELSEVRWHEDLGDDLFAMP